MNVLPFLVSSYGYSTTLLTTGCATQKIKIYFLKQPYFLIKEFDIY